MATINDREFIQSVTKANLKRLKRLAYFFDDYEDFPMNNHPDLFTFTDCFGGEIILDLSTIRYVQTKSNGEVHVWMSGDDLVDFPPKEKQALITAWSHYKQRLHTTK